MKKTIRNGALTLSLVAGIAMSATTVMARSILQDGDFGGTYSEIGPHYNSHVKNRYRHYYGPPSYAYGPRYYYGPPYYYYDSGPGVGFSVTIQGRRPWG